MQKRILTFAILFILFSPFLQAQVIFSNADPIDLPGESAEPEQSLPYPSPIQVTGVPGLIRHVKVSLHGFTHTYPDALDVMLVAPNGVNVTILSDVGGAVDVMDLNITLDDSAASFLPDAGELTTGTFKPTNAGSADSWPSPAPAPSVNKTLSAFNGYDPNGSWKLYVVNDASNSPAFISGGWSLTISTNNGGLLETAIEKISAAYIPDQRAVLLDWIFSAKIQDRIFFIEASKDMTEWKQLAKMNALSENQNHMSYLDRRDDLNEKYYRLKIMDRAGNCTYSKILSVNIPSINTGFNFYPNPAASFIYINTNTLSEGKISIRLIDLSGKVVKNETNNMLFPYQLDLSDQKTGTYLLKVFYDGHEHVKKLIINK